MKFYEKIIGIDATNKTDMTITFDNGQVEFDKIYTNSLAIASSSGNSALHLTATGTDTWTGKFDNEAVLTGDVAHRFIYSPFPDLMTLGSAAHPFNGYFRSIRIAPSSGNNTLHLAATGADTWTGKLGNQAELIGDFEQRYIYCPSQDPITLGIPSNPFMGYFDIANITTAKIADKLEIKNKTVIIPADSSISDLRLPVVSHIEKGLAGGYSHQDFDFTVPTDSPGIYYKISIRSGNFRIPAGKKFYAVDYNKKVTNTNPFIVLSPASAVGNIRGWVSSSDSDGFVVDLQKSAGEDLWGRYFHYSLGTSNTVA